MQELRLLVLLTTRHRMLMMDLQAPVNLKV